MLRLVASAACGIALAIPVCGCGGTGAQSYGEVLHSLRAAAESDTTYGALDQAEGLGPAQRSVLRAFCNFAWQIGVNREAYKLVQHKYVYDRIRESAELKAPPKYKSAAGAAMHRLRRELDLFALRAGNLKRYSHACH